MLSKLGAQESHGAPTGLYLLLFWITFWPGAALAGMAAPAVWRARREPGAQYLLAWLVPSWIVFELVLTKLPHYVLPLYPAIAILTVGALAKRPAVDESGRIVARDQMTLSLVCDHRILYGADGAQFLARVKELLEQPLSLAL